MPNQLAHSKRRQSLAEHKAVLAALAKIAAAENTTVMALLRQAGRDVVPGRRQVEETLLLQKYRLTDKGRHLLSDPNQLEDMSRLHSSVDDALRGYNNDRY